MHGRVRMHTHVHGRVRMHTHTCVCMRAHMHMHTCVCMRVHMHTHTCVRVCVCAWCMHAFVRMPGCACVCAHVRVYAAKLNLELVKERMYKCAYVQVVRLFVCVANPDLELLFKVRVCSLVYMRVAVCA